MADPNKYTAHINRKGLDTTGITEDHVRAMASRLGSSTMLIVEARHLTATVDAEGNTSLALALTSVEPVPAEHDETVRRFQRGLYLQRPEEQGQAVIKGTAGDNEESLASAAQGLAAAVETDQDGAVTGIWNGDPDAPLDGPIAVPDPPEGGYCPFPGCAQENGHDGDHDPDDDPEDPEGEDGA